MPISQDFFPNFIAEELYEFGVDPAETTAISMAMTDVLDSPVNRNIAHVVSYCPRKDNKLTIDVLYYAHKEPVILDSTFKLARKIMGDVFLIRNFPHGGYSVRMITPGPVMAREVKE